MIELVDELVDRQDRSHLFLGREINRTNVLRAVTGLYGS